MSHFLFLISTLEPIFIVFSPFPPLRRGSERTVVVEFSCPSVWNHHIFWNPFFFPRFFFQVNFILWLTNTKSKQCFSSVLFLGRRPVAQNFIFIIKDYTLRRVSQSVLTLQIFFSWWIRAHFSGNLHWEM